MRLHVYLVFAVVVCVHADALSQTTQPATEAVTVDVSKLTFGPSKAGLRVALMCEQPPAVNALRVRLVLHNAGSQPVELSDADEVFAWFFLAHSPTKMWWTEKLAMPMGTTLPKSLAGGQVVALPTIELTVIEAYDYASRQTLLKQMVGEQISRKTEPVGRVSELIKPGRLAVRAMFCARVDGVESLVVKSARVRMTVGEARDDAGATDTKVDGLLKRFSVNAASAQRAHGDAIKLGPDVVPALAKAVKNVKAHEHTRMWLAAAIADIRCQESADELASLLNDKTSSVRQVAAYHGVKQRSETLDEAIVQAAMATDGPLLIRALQGFATFRQALHPKLANKAVTSKNADARKALLSLVRKYPTRQNLTFLPALLKDPDPQIRQRAEALSRATTDTMPLDTEAPE